MATLDTIFDNGGPRVIVINIKPLDASGDVTNIWLTSRPRQITLSSETPASTPFIYRKELRSWEATFKFSDSSSLLGEGFNDFGKLNFDNIDRLLDTWTTYNFDDAAFTVYIGLEMGIDALEYPFASYATYAKGKCKELTRNKKRLVIPLDGQLSALKTRAIIDNIKLKYVATFASSTAASIAYHSSFDFSTGLTVEVAVLIDGRTFNTARNHQPQQ